MKHSHLDDFELLKEVLAGTRGAFEEFFSRFRNLIYTCIQKVFMRHGLSHTQDDLDEIFAQVMYNLVKDDMHRLRVYDPTRGYKVSSWLCLIATNTTYDELRRTPRYTLCLDDPDDYREPISQILSPVEESELREKVEILEQAMTLLTERERSFLTMYYIDGLEPPEIAERMGVSVSTVYSKKNKLITKLAKVVKAILREG